MTAYWEIAAHSANDMFSKYKYLMAIGQVFPITVFVMGISFCLRLFLIIASLYLFVLIRSVFGHCLLGTLLLLNPILLAFK